jgi:septin family protein
MNGGVASSESAPRIVGGLDEDLDLQVLRALQGKTTVVPVISKADAITSAHMNHLKRVVWDSLKEANLDPLEALGLDDSLENDDIEEEDEPEDEEQEATGNSSDSSMLIRQTNTTEKPSTPTKKEPSSASASPAKSAMASSPKSARQPSTPAPVEETPYLPLSIISPDIYDPGTIGRKFPWGFADPYNAEHCDFVRLKEAVFSEWRGELREASRELWYEGWRTSRLGHRKK